MNVFKIFPTCCSCRAGLAHRIPTSLATAILQVTPFALLTACLVFTCSLNLAHGQVNDEVLKKISAALPEKSPAEPKQPRRVLLFSKTNGFRHASIPVAVKALSMLGEKTKAFTAVHTEDDAVFEPDSLQHFHAVIMVNTTGELFRPKELPGEEGAKRAAIERESRLQKSLVDFVRSGKGLAGMHSATDTYANWKEYNDMMGGAFAGHPWHTEVPVRLLDANHPLNKVFGGKGFTITDEIYQFRNDTARPDARRMLLSLDPGWDQLKLGNRDDKFYPISWISKYGEGRTFYCSLGHRDEIYYHPAILEHYLSGIQYALGDLSADAEPLSIPKADRAPSADAIKSSQVLPSGPPNDKRLAALKDLDGYFPFQVPTNLEVWQQRAAEVKQRILVSTGLWPLPRLEPVKPTVHGRVERDLYTVDRVFFESAPGFFVTGSLYLPKKIEGSIPAVLCPHGHWNQGRFHDLGPDEVRKEIVNGAERFEKGGRHPVTARCVQLARMGCAVFIYDMIGYADSQQISQEVAHGHRTARPQLENGERWGLFTAQAEMRLQNVLGLQTLNSLRALEFIETLPYVDKTRISVTGASGGGTQTMLLGAIDARIAVAFPAVMVSTAMQGGCTCENANCLRVDTGNIEFAALFAPKPMGLTAANDWTVELASKGLPELKRLYSLYRADDKVEGYPLTHFGHNYNYVSRAKMYHWMNRHFKLGLPEPILEEDFEPLSVAEMSVWNDQHPRPKSGEAFETELLRTMAEKSDQQIRSALPGQGGSVAEFQRIAVPAYETILRCRWSQIGSVHRDKKEKIDRGSYWLFKDLVRNSERGSELPTLFFHPKQWNGQVVIWVSGFGKASLMDESGTGPRAEVQNLLDAGISVLAADLMEQGEFVAGAPSDRTRKVANERDFSGYTFGYNDTLFAQRVQDILTLVKFVKDDEHRPQSVSLLGVEGGASLAAAARMLAPEQIRKLAIDDGDFRFQRLTSWRDPQFLPGSVKYLDLPGMLGLQAPHPLWLATRNGELPPVTKDLYQGNGAQVIAKATNNPIVDAIHWLK